MTPDISADSGPSLIRYRAGRGEPLVLLPGLGADWVLWSPILPALSRHAHVLALDLPGLGRPPVRRTEPSIGAVTDVVADEIERAGLDEPLVVGESLGGWVALELARRGLVRAVVAISPAGMAFGLERAYAVASLHASAVAARFLRPVAPLLARSTMFRTLFFAQTRARPWQLPPDIAAAELEVMAGSPAFLDNVDHLITRQQATGLEDIDRPVLILWGANDRLVLPYQALRFQRQIPGAQLRIIAGAGHAPISDLPADVAGAIVDFFDLDDSGAELESRALFGG